MDVLTVSPGRPEPLRYNFRGVARGCSTVNLHSALPRAKFAPLIRGTGIKRRAK